MLVNKPNELQEISQSCQINCGILLNNNCCICYLFLIHWS